MNFIKIFSQAIGFGLLYVVVVASGVMLLSNTCTNSYRCEEILNIGIIWLLISFVVSIMSHFQKTNLEMKWMVIFMPYIALPMFLVLITVISLII